MLVTKTPARLLLVLAALTAGMTSTAGPAAGAEAPRLTLERLYSLPSLIGTAPSGFAWSSDGKRLAFLWNDEGRNFRDVWTVDVDDPQLEPSRRSRMPHPTGPRASGDPVVVAAQSEARERHPGVTWVAWTGDGRSLVAAYERHLWLLSENEPPRRLEATSRARRPAVSPDGREVAFLRDGDLWLGPLAETADGPPSTAFRQTRLAGDDVAIRSFRWAPDGDRIAILQADSSGVPMRGIPDYLTEETTLVEIRRAYPGDEPVRQRLGIVEVGRRQPAESRPTQPAEAKSTQPAEAGPIRPAEAGPVGPAEAGPIGPAEPRWIDLSAEDSGSTQPDLLLSYRWSPAGARLAVDTSDLYAKDRRIFVVDLDETEMAARQIARDRDPENETFYFWRIAWAADGERLYFLSDRADDYHVWAVDPAGGEPRRLTAGEWAVAEMLPLRDGLIAVGNLGVRAERHLAWIDKAGGEPVRLSRHPGTHAPVIAPSGRHAAVAFSSDSTPPDLLLTRLDPAVGDREAERRVTRSPLPEFDRYRWVTPTYPTFPSHVDGTTLHGRLTLPPDFDPEKKYPAILGSIYTDSVRNQWGGRTAHPTWGLDQFLAQQGYVLLNVNMRGSWGLGREHRRGIRLDYGGMDIEDLESGVRFLGELGYVDMERVGIWGSSYGGLMTAMSLFRKPGLYAAGVAGAPATNVWHALTGQMAVMMRPEDQPEEYADSSPFLHADGLEDPLLIIHGMRDRVVLFKDSVTLVQRLVQLDKDVDLVALPDAGHGWDNEGLAQTRFAFRKLVEFFDRHLENQKP